MWSTNKLVCFIDTKDFSLYCKYCIAIINGQQKLILNSFLSSFTLKVNFVFGIGVFVFQETSEAEDQLLKEIRDLKIKTDIDFFNQVSWMIKQVL
jgi:hypothetical protein